MHVRHHVHAGGWNGGMIDYDALKHVWERQLGDMKDEHREYELPAGVCPSVTQVLNGYSDFLWVHLCKIEEYVSGLVLADSYGQDVATWIEGDGGTFIKVDVPALACLKDGRHVSYAGLRYMKQAADRGQGIHFLFEAWGEGIRPEPGQSRELAEWMVMERHWKADPEELSGFLGSAIRWLDYYQPEFEHQEMIVNDPIRGYAGRCDARVAMVDKVRCIPDIKSHDTWKRTWAMQLAAYRACPIGYVRTETGLDTIEIPREWQELPGCSIMVTPERTGHRFIEPDLMSYYRDRFYSALDGYKGANKGPLPTGRAKWIKAS